jgi:hypothetical protein
MHIFFSLVFIWLVFNVMEAIGNMRSPKKKAAGLLRYYEHSIRFDRDSVERGVDIITERTGVAALLPIPAATKRYASRYRKERYASLGTAETKQKYATLVAWYEERYGSWTPTTK